MVIDSRKEFKKILKDERIKIDLEEKGIFIYLQQKIFLNMV